ncbi:hypothetical protein P43SY_005819 [Pythium insidiosum]|uniref:Uncharacterized protein n=1 Tax=Pythium insidiosum TaxID=114742 RepID=A0AAD5LTG2_PYTIN|nr:hypothetical protein P43SY_005819 [Pythium insidiosum]
MDADDEDCYGFGALSDMFDASASSVSSSSVSSSSSSAAASVSVSSSSGPPAASAKRLDVSALSRFWWSERRLSDFRRSRQRLAADFQHVAAKFDGQRVDGGLGAVYVVPRGAADDGGVLWEQSAASDSNAQARRKKEFQDITNRHDALQTPRGSTKSTSTIFLRSADILRCEPTAVQHTALGVKLSLRQGHDVEFVFMPGPFRGPHARDDFLQALQSELARGESVPTPRERTESKQQNASVPVARSPSRDAVQLRGASDASLAVRGISSPTPSTRRAASSPVVETMARPITRANDAASSTPLSNEFRALVRQYVRRRDHSSPQSIEIAAKLHSATGYHVGPLSETQPKFSADATYRRETVGRLSKMLEKMNQEWKDVESEREARTRAKCVKDDDDVFQYTDTDTNHQLSPATYRRRYLDYVGAHDVDPVIRFALGVDITGSSIINADFFTALRQLPEVADKPQYLGFVSALEAHFKATPLHSQSAEPSLRRLRAQAQAELARQVDAFFAAARSKVFSEQHVHAAANRNYDIEKRKLQLQLRAAAEREHRERQTCTFRPTLKAPRSAKLAAVPPRYLEPTSKPASDRIRSTSSRRSTDAAAFSRLTSARERPPESLGLSDAPRAVASPAQIASFLERQQRFLEQRSTRIAQLVDETQPPFRPELSSQTRALSERMQSQSVDELLAQRRRRRLRRLEHSIGPAAESNGSRPSRSSAPSPVCTTRRTPRDQDTAAFQRLLVELLNQERRMKALDQRRRSV